MGFPSTETALDTVTRTQGNNQALKDGSLSPRGFTLRFTEVPVLVQAFRRMVRGLEFDVSEMAFTTYLCAKAHGKPFTALPIFLVRGFHHGAVVCHTGSGLGHPKDLEGRRVGVNRGYTVTTGVWARGVLQDEYGVDLNRVTWVLSGDEHVSEYVPPTNVVPLGQDEDLTESLVRGDLAAAIGIAPNRPDVTTLLPDAQEAGYDALVRNGLYPINHLMVVRDDVLAANPGLARSLFDVFAEAKNRYVERLRKDEIESPTRTDLMYRRVMNLTGSDPLPYGIAPNRAMIEKLVAHAVSQRILDDPVPVESLFPESTHDLTA